jgi:cell filamentation protein
MYEVDDDTYCYPGTTVLRNLLDLTTQAELDAFEAEITLQRSTEPLPAGKLDDKH